MHPSPGAKRNTRSGSGEVQVNEKGVMVSKYLIKIYITKNTFPPHPTPIILVTI
jgi:hypothetical protein